MKKRIVIAVISDLVTDQRVHKVSLSLQQSGYDVVLIGAKRRKSRELTQREYPAKRITMLFQKGPLFYAEWNIRLFFRLAFMRADAITANDLDTLPASFIASKIKQCRIVYDTHEYFTEMEELQGRKTVQKTWRWIERRFFKRLKHIYTVNQSIADVYEKLYAKKLVVVRNLPLRQNVVAAAPVFPEKKILLCQGAGLHGNRGLEELLLSLNYLPEEFTVTFAGSGLAIDQLKRLSEDQHLEHRVVFTGLLPMQELAEVTRTAFLGFSLDKPNSLNQLYSLPNKLFDYLAAGKPVIVSDLPEVKKIVVDYKAGSVVSEITPAAIAEAVMQLAKNKEQYLFFSANAVTAAKELCWENERVKLIKLYTDVFNRKPQIPG